MANAKHDRPQTGPGTHGEGWREEVERLARRLLSDEDVTRLAERFDDVGQVGDLVVAAHLDDVLYVERARYHRARRELARSLATEDEETPVARRRLQDAGASLAVFRLQRDLATGAVELPLPEPFETGPDRTHDGPEKGPSQSSHQSVQRPTEEEGNPTAD